MMRHNLCYITNKLGDSFIKCSYVHELQHFLKLMGEQEIANNLKMLKPKEK